MAGLTAAYELIKAGIKPIVLEKADKVGGIAAPRHTRDTTLTLDLSAFYTPYVVLFSALSPDSYISMFTVK